MGIAIQVFKVRGQRSESCVYKCVNAVTRRRRAFRRRDVETCSFAFNFCDLEARELGAKTVRRVLSYGLRVLENVDDCKRLLELHPSAL